jgi:hypothetical protein
LFVEFVKLEFSVTSLFFIIFFTDQRASAIPKIPKIASKTLKGVVKLFTALTKFPLTLATAVAPLALKAVTTILFKPFSNSISFLNSPLDDETANFPRSFLLSLAETEASGSETFPLNIIFES